LAFRSDDEFIFKKSWGTQLMPPGSWLIVPMIGMRPGGDLYGCDAKEFAETYRPCAGEANQFEKHTEVLAYQPGRPFMLPVLVGSHVEVERATGGECDWLVRNPSGNVYPVPDTVFRASYRRVDDS